MSPRIHPSLLLPLILASACSPQEAAAPVVPPAANSTSKPFTSPAPSTAPSPSSPIGDDGLIEEAGDEPPPLPSDAFDPGDLSLEEGESFQKALALEDLSSYFPGDLIHDGGVILYRIQQQSLGLRPHASGPIGLVATPAKQGCLRTEALPERWQRTNFKAGGRQIQLRRQAKGQVLATVISTNRSSLRYRLPGHPRLQEKRYNERFTRDLLLEMQAGRVQLIELGPIELGNPNARNSPNFTSLTIRQSPSSPPLAQWLPKSQNRVPLAQIPNIQAQSELFVELQLAEGLPCPPYLFTHFMGPGGLRERIPLRDDGTQGDAQAQDGIFSARLLATSRPGLAHLAVEALASSSFEGRNPYQGLAIGLSLRIQAKP